MHSLRLPISRPPLIHVEALTKVFYGDEVEILSAPSGRELGNNLADDDPNFVEVHEKRGYGKLGRLQDL